MRARLAGVFLRSSALLLLGIGLHGCGFKEPTRCIVARSPNSEWHVTGKEISRRLLPTGYVRVEVSRAGQPAKVIYESFGDDFPQFCIFEVEWSKDSSAFVLFIKGCVMPPEIIAYSTKEERLSQHQELESALFQRLGRRYQVPGILWDVIVAIRDSQDVLALRKEVELTNYPTRCVEYGMPTRSEPNAR